MKVNKKAVFMLGACYGVFVTISGVIAAKVFNKVLDDKIDKKVGTKCSNNLCYPHNSYSSPFGFGNSSFDNADDFMSNSSFDNADNFKGNSSFGEDDDLFGNSSFGNADDFMSNSTYENTSKNDPDTIFFESED